MASFFTYYLDAEVRATVVPASNCSQDWLLSFWKNTIWVFQFLNENTIFLLHIVKTQYIAT